MDTEEITAQIMSAWDELEGTKSEEEEETVDTVDAPVPTPTLPEQSDADETGGGNDDEDAEEQTEGEPEEETPAEEEPEQEEEEDEEEPAELPPVTASFDDPEVQAFIAKYQGDPEQALKGAVELTRVLNRQGLEKNELARRVEALEAELQQAQAFQGNTILNEDQRQWVETAIESDNPRGYIQAAMQEGQFDLARAVCDQWAEASPYEAMRAAQQVDAIEQRVVAQQQAEAQQQALLEEPNPQALLDALVPYYPEIPQYADRMTEIINTLGPAHPLVADARGLDPNAAVRGVLGILEIARASTAVVSETRQQIKQKKQQEATSARESAVVSSGQSAPSKTETPRPTRLGPGLTLEDLDAHWK